MREHILGGHARGPVMVNDAGQWIRLCDWHVRGQLNRWISRDVGLPFNAIGPSPILEGCPKPERNREQYRCRNGEPAPSNSRGASAILAAEFAWANCGDGFARLDEHRPGQDRLEFQAEIDRE